MRLLFLLLAFLVVGGVSAQADGTKPAYNISFEIEGFADSAVYLANYFMDKQYIVDTAAFENGQAVFTGDEPLKEGTYLLVLPPNNNYAQLLIDGDQEFSLKTNVDDLTGAMVVKGSSENELFYDYLHFLSEQRPIADKYRAIKQDSTQTAEAIAQATIDGDAVDKAVEDRQQMILTKHPETITASILLSMQNPNLPEFTGTDAEQQQQRYLWYKKHYFDNVNLGDPRSLRSTFLDKQVMYYMDKLVIPAPDSLIKEIDFILEQMRPSEETFRQYTSKFLNQYASSKIVGQDAVYIHIAEKYYMGGQTPWVDSTTLAKITENVNSVKPLLIGKKAPPLKLVDRNEQPWDLYEDDADFTVLFFYDPECGYCKKQTPFVVDFAKKFKDKNVKVVSICSKFAPDKADCWEYVDSKDEMNDLLYNLYDPYHRSRFKITYNVTSTPQVYVLDKNDIIVSKKIAGDQLEEVVGRLVDEKEKMEMDGAGK
jgi:peroxiredoxin